MNLWQGLAAAGAGALLGAAQERLLRRLAQARGRGMALVLGAKLTLWVAALALALTLGARVLAALVLGVSIWYAGALARLWRNR